MSNIEAVRCEIKKARLDNVITLDEAKAIVAAAKHMRVDEAAEIQALRKTLPQPVTAEQKEITWALDVHAEDEHGVADEVLPVMALPMAVTAWGFSTAVDNFGISDSGKSNFLLAFVGLLVGLWTLVPSIALTIVLSPATAMAGEIRRTYLNVRD